jgi:hypothetical protein
MCACVRMVPYGEHTEQNAHLTYVRYVRGMCSSVVQTIARISNGQRTQLRVSRPRPVGGCRLLLAARSVPVQGTSIAPGIQLKHCYHCGYSVSGSLCPTDVQCAVQRRPRCHGDRAGPSPCPVRHPRPALWSGVTPHRLLRRQLVSAGLKSNTPLLSMVKCNVSFEILLLGSLWEAAARGWRRCHAISQGMAPGDPCRHPSGRCSGSNSITNRCGRCELKRTAIPH